MKKITFVKALVYYDGLQVFIAEDQFGARYICTLVEQTESMDKYLCVPVSVSHLSNLIKGEIDLREVYEDTENEHYLIIESSAEKIENLESDVLPISDLPKNWLPEQGFYLESHPISDKILLNEAYNKSRTIIHCKLNPPEALIESKIYADHLSQATILFQRLVKYAFRRSIRSLDKNARAELSDDSNYRLEIFGFSPGSFTLHIQSAALADLIGYTEIIKALQIIDKTAALASTPSETVEQISQFGGHFATSYKNLLRFISETETQFEYKWASPDRETITGYGISSLQAKPLYEALSERTDIGVEKIRLKGILTKVDEKLKTWRIINDDDHKEYSGLSETEMAGLIIETQKYELLCEERLEEERGTGREYTKLYLISIRRL